jgi:anti-anti-sigma factor
MKIVVRHIGHVSVLDLSGNLTIGKPDVMLRESIQDLLAEERLHLLINLEKVPYMDSAGIAELVACHKRVVEKGGHIKLLNPTGKVYDLFQITKLDQIFPTYEDEKEALVSF